MNNLHARRILLFALTLAIGIVPSALQAQADEKPPATFAESLKKGKAKVSLRYRFEAVSDDNPPVSGRDAEASTLRTALRYSSLPYRGFSLFLEAENVSVVGDDRYNNRGGGSLANGVTDRPVVADPALTEINQAYLSFARGNTTLRAGRQEILIGNQRFVGNVGWRQNHQSFDSASLVNNSLDRLTVAYHYIANVNRIFGDNREMNSHLLHGEIEIDKNNKLSLYTYYLDFDSPFAAASAATVGARIEGKRKRQNTTFSYAAEFATQQDAADNPRRIDANYYLAELAVGWPAFTVKVGYEVLEGESGQGAFATPLATLHKFNGWADRFLVTPQDGLEDVYLSLSGGAGRFKWAAIYHDFSANSGSASYGTELDLLATFKTHYNQTFGFKAAFYDADEFSFDTDKYMVWTAYSFGS